jgi:hypothetical protein
LIDEEEITKPQEYPMERKQHNVERSTVYKNLKEDMIAVEQKKGDVEWNRQLSSG